MHCKILGYICNLRNLNEVVKTSKAQMSATKFESENKNENLSQKISEHKLFARKKNSDRLGVDMKKLNSMNFFLETY